MPCPKLGMCPPCSCTGPRAASTRHWLASGQPAPVSCRLSRGRGGPSRVAWRGHPEAGSRVGESTWATASGRPGNGSQRPVNPVNIHHRVGMRQNETYTPYWASHGCAGCFWDVAQHPNFLMPSFNWSGSRIAMISWSVRHLSANTHQEICGPSF